jgi:hypothetical protein
MSARQRGVARCEQIRCVRRGQRRTHLHRRVGPEHSRREVAGVVEDRAVTQTKAELWERPRKIPGSHRRLLVSCKMRV